MYLKANELNVMRIYICLTLHFGIFVLVAESFQLCFTIFLISFTVGLTVAACSIFYQQHSNLIVLPARNRYLHEIQYGWSFHVAIVTIILIIASFLMQLFSCVYWKDKEVSQVEYTKTFSE